MHKSSTPPFWPLSSFVFIITLLITVPALADSVSDSGVPETSVPERRAPESHAVDQQNATPGGGHTTINSNTAALDERLPPVLPGEEVMRGGKKMKVWSTGGSPSVGNAPPAAPQNQGEWTVGGDHGEGVSVVLDGRELLPNRPIRGR